MLDRIARSERLEELADRAVPLARIIDNAPPNSVAFRETAAERAEIVITAGFYVDVAIRWPQLFCYSQANAAGP